MGESQVCFQRHTKKVLFDILILTTLTKQSHTHTCEHTIKGKGN